ncbi:MAG: hypothetical protein Q7T74_05295 [Candidatus Saccharibacteria bacterium]|nr:hypothetical protein [Candidatus Saccharibacteria bacterium]
MINELPVRLWLGWRRLKSIPTESDWEDFKANLSETFIPATWEFMKEYKLQTYVPSIFHASGDRGNPEEVALLCYLSKEDYDKSKMHFMGRSYRIMHQAIFNFDGADRVSTAKWCGPVGSEGPQIKKAKNGCIRFSDPNASIHVLMLSTPTNCLSSNQLFDALSNHHGDVAIWQKENFIIVWIASPRIFNESEIGEQFYQLLIYSCATLVAFHSAEKFSFPVDPHIGIPKKENKSWHFFRRLDQN